MQPFLRGMVVWVMVTNVLVQIVVHLAGRGVARDILQHIVYCVARELTRRANRLDLGCGLDATT